MVTCASCGRENPPDSRFCNSCGAPLAAEPARREERKVVTVLFADLVGFTSRAEQLDPEDVRTMLASYWQHLRDELEHYGGTVEKFIGDAVMALFGAPVAHEDDPERAVRAALAIRDWAREQPDVQVRIAVNTGEALVLLGAKPSEGEGMATGDVVNTAARLQSAAPVNGVLVGELTYRATRGVIDYVEREPVVAKGKSEPLRVWEPSEARSRFTIETMSAAPLAGREDEVELLVSTLQRVRRDREPQLVTVAGVPGIGKSRLVSELFAFVEADADFITWRRGRSLSYGHGVSLWALGEIAKAELGVLESDTRAETATKLEHALTELAEDEREQAWLARHLAPLLGLPSEQEDRAERFGAWRRWIELLADRRPTVLVFEDIQWADDELLDFIDELADWASDLPLLVVCTARPELFERRPGWGGGKRNVLTVSLGPLSDDDTARVVAATLDRAVLPAATQTALLERAAGNPLYAEQYARMVAEGGVPDALPETVQGIVAARLDLLAPEEKALLQDAAVVGRVFWPGALGAADELLRSLVRTEFIRRERRSSVAGEQEYSFAHALVRDVAYAQIPRGERAARHRAAAAWIESLPPDRAVDRAEMLAHHYGAALELALAAGSVDDELRARARDAFHNAGDRALALGAFAAARRHFAAALELTAEGTPEWARLRGALGSVLSSDDPQAALDHLEHAAAAFMELGELEGAAQAELDAANAWWYLGNRDEADVHSERAVSLLADAAPSEAKAAALAQRARLLMLAAKMSASAELATAAIEIAEQIGSERILASAVITRATALQDEAGIRRGVELAEQAHDAHQLFRGLNNICEHLIRNGELDATRPIYERFRREAEQAGWAGQIAWVRVQEAGLCLVTGDWDEALATVEAVIAEIESGKPHYLEADVRATRSSIRQARGDAAGAIADAEQAVAAARTSKDPQTIVPALANLADVYVREGRVDAARATIDETVVILRPLERHYYTEALTLLWPTLDLGFSTELIEIFDRGEETDLWTNAAIAAWRGDLAAAAAVLERCGARWFEAELRIRIAERERDQGELRRALAFFRGVGATRRVRDGEALLAATA
jgi:class 3 adenylate cyclase/tetratricopeptide (TPR) repeat protein